MRESRRQQSKNSFLYTHEGGVGDDVELHLTSLGSNVVIEGTGISLDQCGLNRTMVIAAAGIQVRGCTWDTVEAANADMERSGWRGSLVSGCRFTGVRINSSHVGKTTFVDCKMDLLQCQLATLQEVRFEHCDLRGAYFSRSQMPGTVFEGSDLTGADFSGTTITGCDFRRAIIEDIRVAPEQLAGVVVSADQALYLARLFGLNVQE